MDRLKKGWESKRIPIPFIRPLGTLSLPSILSVKNFPPSAECAPPNISKASRFGRGSSKQRKPRSGSSNCPAAYRSGGKDSPYRKTRPFCCSALLYSHSAVPNKRPTAAKWKGGSLPAAAADAPTVVALLHEAVGQGRARHARGTGIHGRALRKLHAGGGRQCLKK